MVKLTEKDDIKSCQIFSNTYIVHMVKVILIGKTKMQNSIQNINMFYIKSTNVTDGMQKLIKGILSTL